MGFHDQAKFYQRFAVGASPTEWREENGGNGSLQNCKCCGKRNPLELECICCCRLFSARGQQAEGEGSLR